MPRQPFYLTTPIFYVNDVPHIGHAYTEVAADILSRWHRQAGDDTWLRPRTDDHRQNKPRTAIATDKRHEKALLGFLQELCDDVFIYKGEYEGYYCVGCEEYKQLDGLMETPA